MFWFGAQRANTLISRDFVSPFGFLVLLKDSQVRFYFGPF